jgi:hypothetical protein
MVQIKTLLMDQKVIRGIGNTYADEIFVGGNDISLLGSERNS